MSAKRCFCSNRGHRGTSELSSHTASNDLMFTRKSFFLRRRTLWTQGRNPANPLRAPFAHETLICPLIGGQLGIQARPTAGRCRTGLSTTARPLVPTPGDSPGVEIESPEGREPSPENPTDTAFSLVVGEFQTVSSRNALNPACCDSLQVVLDGRGSVGGRQDQLLRSKLVVRA